MHTFKPSPLTVFGYAMVVAVLASHGVAYGQFNSGSTGALGALAPATNTTVVLPADGILNYTTVTIPSTVTVTFQRNAGNTPVYLLAQGAVSIAGKIVLDGEAASIGSGTNYSIVAGRKGGPGGFDGGAGGMRGPTPTGGSGGQGPGGGTAGTLPAIASQDGRYIPNGTVTSLIPLFGGAGGGGGTGQTAQYGAAGAGGGGAIVIASTTHITVQVTGVITANGGASNSPCSVYGGASGSGGAVRLVAPQITNQGTIYARGGSFSCVNNGLGVPGRVRIECTTCSVTTTDPVASVVNQLGPITSSSTPPLSNVPTLSITSIAGSMVPAAVTGSLGTPDLALPPTVMNPVTVSLTATNVPVPTQFVIKVTPTFGESTFFPSTFSSGTLATSTATASVLLPAGQVYVLDAYAGYSQ